jgi:16S rRNA G966 N2-methylase RsmD
MSSAELLGGAFQGNPVILISANLPGCGSSTVAEMLGGQISSDLGVDVHTRFIGQELRRIHGAKNDQELRAKLSEINDPESYDAQIYADLPTDVPCIFEGKLATAAGPQFLEDTDRPILSVNLISKPLFSAKRISTREGATMAELFSEHPDAGLLENLRGVDERATHEESLRQKIGGTAAQGGRLQITESTFDTSRLSAQEVVDSITGSTERLDHVPAWELAALNDTLRTLTLVGLDTRASMLPQDKIHFEHQLESIGYNIDRLGMTLNAQGLEQIRADLKKCIIDCWFGLMLKKTPRFLSAAETGEITYDTVSHKWSPEYYKIAEGWPTLSTMLKDKVVLDPFAGAGTLMNLLVARDIPKSAIMSDISYPGGETIDGNGHYSPELNAQAALLLFDELPSSYKPDFDPIVGYITADARNMPYADNCVDYVFADPPYGKNKSGAGLGVLFGSIAEFNRVAREGSILMVPITWVEEIKGAGHSVKQLTRDVSGGKSGLPVCYVLVESPRTPTAEEQLQLVL